MKGSTLWALAVSAGLAIGTEYCKSKPSYTAKNSTEITSSYKDSLSEAAVTELDCLNKLNYIRKKQLGQMIAAGTDKEAKKMAAIELTAELNGLKGECSEISTKVSSDIDKKIEDLKKYYR
jgi:hypothetical protein